MRVENIYHAVPAAALADIYTAGPDASTILLVVATNNTGAPAALSLQRIPPGGVAAYLLNGKSVPANDYHRLQGPIALGAGEKLAARNHTASALTLLVVALLA